MVCVKASNLQCSLKHSKEYLSSCRSSLNALSKLPRLVTDWPALVEKSHKHQFWVNEKRLIRGGLLDALCWCVTQKVRFPKLHWALSPPVRRGSTISAAWAVSLVAIVAWVTVLDLLARIRLPLLSKLSESSCWSGSLISECRLFNIFFLRCLSWIFNASFYVFLIFLLSSSPKDTGTVSQPASEVSAIRIILFLSMMRFTVSSKRVNDSVLC